MSARRPHRSLTALIALAVSAAALGALPAGAGAATTPPTLSSPASGTTVGGQISVSYTLPQTPLAGSVQLTFSGTTTTSLTLSNASGSSTFSFSASDPAASADVQAVGGHSTIPDGVYTVTLSYQDAAADPSSSASATGVTVDTSTHSPVLSAPSSGVTVRGPLSVDYSLPQAALAGSVSMTFSGAVTRVLTMVDASPSGAFQLDPSDPRGSPQVASISGGTTIPDGAYTVTVSYQNYLGDPLASSDAVTVTLDNSTLQPTLTTPAGAANTSAPFSVSYSLPEAALAGSVKLSLSGPLTCTLTLAESAAGAHTLTLNPDDPGASTGVTASPGCSALSAGSYTLTLSYQDAVGNPQATSAPVTLTLTGSSAPPVAAPPVAAPPVAAPPPASGRKRSTAGLVRLSGPHRVVRRCPRRRCRAPRFAFTAAAAETVQLRFIDARGRRELTLRVRVRAAGRRVLRLTPGQRRRLRPGRTRLIALAGRVRRMIRFTVLRS